jgi:hypothetical protein
MSHETSSDGWGFAGVVGAWRVDLDAGPSPDLEARHARVVDVMTKAGEVLSEMHRPWLVRVSWAELDVAGNERTFHDDDPVDVSSWAEVVRCVARIGERGPSVVESVFVEMSTSVVTSEGVREIPESAGLQVSAEADPHGDGRAEVSLVYETRIDVWLAKNRSGTNRALASTNYPRLSSVLQNLARTLQTPLKVHDSSYYLDRVTTLGFTES